MQLYTLYKSVLPMIFPRVLYVYGGELFSTYTYVAASDVVRKGYHAHLGLQYSCALNRNMNTNLTTIPLAL